METNNAQQFLGTIFEGKTDNQLIVIWTDDKKSKFFREVNDAAAHAEARDGQANVYFGIGLLGHQPTEGRGKEEDVIAIPGLWVDVDIADAAHQKTNLPETIDDAMAIIGGLEWKPSLVVNTGHGVHVYWLFREPLEFHSDEDRQQAKSLVQRFQAYLRSLFLAKGWTLDSTHDLSRPLRVAGTLNVKREPHVRSSIIEQSNERYNPSDFDGIPEIETGKATKNVAPIDMDGIVLDPDASPPFDRIMMFCEADPNFEKSWNHTRKDFPSGDYSQSTYDQSLATMAILAGWEDQDVVNLVISNRRMWKQDLKLRPDYYKRLLQNGHAAAKKTEACKAIDTDQAFIEETETPAKFGARKTPEQCQKIWKTLSEIWGFRITRVVRTIIEPRIFRIEYSLPDEQQGRIELGEAGNILKQAVFASLVAGQTLKVIDEEKRLRWRKIARSLIESAQDEDLGTEATDVGIVSEWLTSYLDMNRPCPEHSEKWEREINAHQPFMREGKTYFFFVTFMHWVQTSGRNTLLTEKRLAKLLKLIECHQEKFWVRVKSNERKCVQVRRMPDGFMTRNTEIDDQGQVKGEVQDDEEEIPF